MKKKCNKKIHFGYFYTFFRIDMFEPYTYEVVKRIKISF